MRRGNWPIRDKFCAIVSIDKSEEVPVRGNTISGWFTERSIGGCRS